MADLLIANSCALGDKRLDEWVSADKVYMAMGEPGTADAGAAMNASATAS